MKLRFGVDPAAVSQIETRLQAMCDDPPSRRRLDHVYLDTTQGTLAAQGVALRFRRTTPLDGSLIGRPWKRQEIWPKSNKGRSLEKISIGRLKKKLDATFTVRIERATWRLRDNWARVSLDRSEVSTGAARDVFTELRVVCKRRFNDEAMHLAVELGAMHLSSTRARERGLALLRGPD